MGEKMRNFFGGKKGDKRRKKKRRRCPHSAKWS
jgi:hypothetical protein